MKTLSNVKPADFLKRAVSTNSTDKLLRKHLLAPHPYAGGSVATDGYRIHYAPGVESETDPAFPTGEVDAYLSAPVETVAEVSGLELKNAAHAAGLPRRGQYEGNAEQIKLLAIPGHGLVLEGKDPDVGKVRAFIPCEIKRRLNLIIDARFIEKAVAGKRVSVGLGHKGTLVLESDGYRAVIQPMEA